MAERTRWIVSPCDRGTAEPLAAALGISSLTAQLLLQRGIDTVAKAQAFLQPRLQHLRRPDGDDAMAGFATAVDLLEQALVNRQIIGIFGDYDVDGVTSCALLTQFLRDAGGTVVPRVAQRDLGYGFGPEEAKAFAAAGCSLVVTCDCGTSDHVGLAEAAVHQLKIIIVDHHQVPDRQPDAAALINPHQADCRFPYKGLASVGVAFYLAAALRTRLKARGWPKLPDPRQLLDLVALGTVCDMAPLTDENRILVSVGLVAMRERPRPGVAALCEISRLPDGVRRTADLGMRLGPRLNAPGRLGSAALSLELLLAPDLATATALANQCEDANKKRRTVQDKVFAEALPQAEAAARAGAHMLVVWGVGWHPGVVGIVAAKLVDRFRRPAAVIAVDGDTGRGSLRSVRGFHLHRALTQVESLLVRYGGHAAAAGLTIDRQHLDLLKQKLDAIAKAELGQGPPEREVGVNAVVRLDELDERLADELAQLEPFGIGNPEPLLGLDGVVLSKRRLVGEGEQHVQVSFGYEGETRHGIGFSMAEHAPPLGSVVRATFLPEVDTWNGQRRLQLRLRDLEPQHLPATAPASDERRPSAP